MKTSLRENVFKYVFIQKGRSLILFFLLAVVNVCALAQSIDAPLREEMNRRSEDEKIKVFVIMKSQYNRTQLNRQASFYSSRSDRRAYVVNELKQFAEASQYDIKKSLATMEKDGVTTEPTVLWVANALSFSATKSAIEELSQRKDIEIIGFDKEEYMLFDEESKPASNTREITQNISQVRANEVWSLGYTGVGIVVAVIDTGVNYDHLDLADHLWDGGEEFPYHGWDFVNNDNDPMDDKGHGTHCAGTICGDGSAGSQTGMAPDATLMILKCLNSLGGGLPSEVINSMQWAVEHGCDVISMSLGFPNPDISTCMLFRNTCVSILDAGVVAAIAAGNEGEDLVSYPIPNNVRVPGSCPPPYLDPQQALNPGGLSCSVCVGAVDYNDSPASFTSRGPVTWAETEFADYLYSPNSTVEFGLIRPDVCAPGVRIKSAGYSSNTGYTLMSGTSMATPCVAGCMALILSKDPNVTPAEMCKLLEETSIPLSDTKSNLTGTGRIDVMAAISNMPSGSLKLNSFSINDSRGNNDHLLNPGEQVSVDLTLLNDSDLSIDNASLVLSTESNHVSITNGTVQLPHFNGQQTQTIENAFSFSLDSEAVSGTVVAFTIEMKVNDETVGVIPFSVTVYDYLLHYKELVVLNDDNGSGSLEPGESADLRIYVENGGNTQANLLVGVLGTNYSYLTLNETTKSFGNIASGGQSYAEYHVTLDGNAPQNYNMDLSLTMTDANNRQTVLEFDHVKYAINATVNIEGSGSITGTGYYDRGTTCTLSITPSEGYLFENWSKEGALEHTTMSYSFVATENVEYVANLIVQNGVYIGSGEDYASALPGCTSTSVKSSVTQQIYTADEIGGAGYINSIAFYNDGNQQTSTYSVYLKHTTKSSFESVSDWESVSSSDMVYSGQFVFPIGKWTTLEFDSPFNYDGNSNLVLVVFDNSGKRNPVFGRAYDGNGYQALYVYSTTDVLDPLNIVASTGNRVLKKNQIILDIIDPNTTYTVSVEPNTPSGGTVNGGSTCLINTSCTVTASPNSGYEFLNWTEKGNVVSTELSYTFTVLKNHNLIANFYSLDPIVFADENVKSLCVANWDTNGDGELSYVEAARVTDLGDVFEYKGNLVSFNELQFFEGLKTIESYAFNGCYSLTSVFIPESVSSIGAGVFKSCSELAQITVAAGNEYYDSRNNCNAIINTKTNQLIAGCQNTIIPNTVQSIGGNAFYGHTGLVSLAIPASVRSIEVSAFGYNGLEQIIVHSGNPVYDSRDNCNAIVRTDYNELVVGCKSSVISNSVIRIGNNAFNNCKSLTALEIPSSVRTIGYSAFEGCSNLSSINIFASIPPTLNGNNVFNGVDKSIPVTVHCEAIDAYGNATGWSAFGNYQTFEDDCEQAITVSVNNNEGGSVSGAGTYNVGETCTILATPNQGYLFTKWTRNGEVLSCNASYSFNVVLGGEYVANFIAVDGLYLGEGEEVSSDIPSNSNYYKYSLSQQIYTAEEIGVGEIHSIAFFNAGTEKTRNYSIYLKPTAKRVFNNGTDWVAVSENDLVFSGDVTMVRGDWTVITLTTPFICDGNSNTVLVVDDNSNSYSSGMQCRVYNANAQQSIYVRSDGTNYDPKNLSLYTGTTLSVKNQIILGIDHDDSFTVSVTKDIDEAGVVTGAGTYDYGVTCTVTAIANEGYAFRYWMENGATLSYNNEISFTVNRDRNLMAVFSADASIPFADANVKALCVANWDTNNDGELSYVEASVVTDLGEVFKNNKTITSFDELQYFTGLTEIGDHAFYSCSSLASIAIPNSVSVINSYAFAFASSLSNIELSSSVITIGDNAFNNCYRLVSIELPNSIATIESSAFISCSGLTSIVIPETVTSIGYSAFRYCTGLEQIVVAEVNAVFDSRNNCNAIIETSSNTLLVGCKNSSIPNTVTALADYAFIQTDIVSITIPESVVVLGTNVFGSCHLLEQISVSENNPVFDSRDHCNAMIESSTNKLVVGCKNSIIPDDITVIGEYAFYNCTGLTSIVVPNQVTSINQYAFGYCYGLTTVDLPNSLTTIEAYAFTNCNRMSSFTIPGSVTSIGSGAFYYCNKLTSITSLATTPPTVGNNAFYNVDKTIPVYVPLGSAADYQVANGWSDFTNIIEDANLPINFADANVKAICVTNWDTNNDGELSYAEAAAVTDLGMKFAANYTITSFDELQFFTGLTAIGADAFLWCHSLSSVVLPNTVTELRVEAFYDCRSLLAITIPASVNSIDPSALNCPNMETLVVEEGNAVYDSRNNCNALILTSENCLVRGCKNTIIPNTVVAIGSNAFSNSAIETVDIPESVSTIYSTSFYACVELSSITVATGNTVYDSRNDCNAIVETNTNTLIAGSISTVIPNTVTSIGAYAFSYRFRSDLHQITIPESIVSIGYGAYMGGYGIEAITVLAEVPPVLGDNVFENVSVDIPVTVPCGTTAAYASATGWSEFTNCQVDASCSYEITAVANPSEGGTVTGNGTYNHNATCTLTATPATGYSFVNWTKDNVEVSTNQEYTFTAIQSGEYQANFSLNSYEITAVANDASLGTVVGGGTYYYGETVTLTATANTGALFRNWTEGGTVVSTDETYSFTTTNDRSIVANFEAIVNHWTPISGNQYNMSVYGIVLIDGVEQMCATLEVGAFFGDECRASACAEFFPPTQQYVVTLTIRSNTDSGEIITFRLYDHHTQQEMALNCASTVTFESNAMIGVNDWFPFAFCNTNNVSVALSPDGAGIVAGAGDYDWGTTATLTASANEGYAFVGWSDNGVMVSTDNPYSFEVTESVTLIAVFDRVEVTALSAGWHWWSTAIELSGLNGLTMLENSLGHYGLEVKSQSASMQNYYQTIGYDYWFGTLTTAGLQNENGYMVRVSDPCSITMTGSVANPSDHPITIESNWNWIGYPVGATQSVSVAMGGVSPESNDVIKGQGWTSTYYSGYGWFPTTPVLSPGNMYMYYSNAVENKTLTFANNREIVAVVNEDPLQWNANTHAYAHNLVVMAMVSVNGKEQRDESLEVGAFVDGECRGSARLIYFEPLDRYYVMMTVSGMEGEHVGFKLINQEKETMNSENGIVFKTDDIVGSLDNPFTLHFNQMSQGFGVVTIYPNPVERGQKLTLLLSDNELPNKVVFYDAMGAMVSSESGDVALSSIKAPSTSGIYTMELVTRTGNVYRCKLVVR